MIGYDDLPEEMAKSKNKRKKMGKLLRLVDFDTERGAIFLETLVAIADHEDVGDGDFAGAILILPKMGLTLCAADEIEQAILELEKSKFVLMHGLFEGEE